MSDLCFFNDFFKDKVPKRYPTNGILELTVRCNLKCKMCLFRHADCENSEIIANELTTAQWINLAKQVADAGTFNLLITGGEPLLRPDFCEIWEEIYKLGFIITLYTNAILVNDKIMDTLTKYPPHKIGITVYGASDDVYNNVCGSVGVFDRMINGVKRLQTLPSIIEFRSTIIKDNVDDVENIQSLIKDGFHSEQKLIFSRNIISSVRGACAKVEKCRLSAKDNVSLYMNQARKALEEEAKLKNVVIDKYNVEISRKKSISLVEDSLKNGEILVPTLFGCDAGMSQYTITWDGKLLPCQILGAYNTEVVNHSFMEAWNLLPEKCKPIILCKECKDCKDYDICDACPASRWAETGDVGGKVQYLCEVTEELLKYM